MKETLYFEEGVKEEEAFLTNMTTQFIKANMVTKSLEINHAKNKTKPAQSEIVKPTEQSPTKVQKHDLVEKIKVIESSLKGKYLSEFRKIVRDNSGTNIFKQFFNNLKLKLKDKLL